MRRSHSRWGGPRTIYAEDGRCKWGLRRCCNHQARDGSHAGEGVRHSRLAQRVEDGCVLPQQPSYIGARWAGKAQRSNTVGDRAGESCAAVRVLCCCRNVAATTQKASLSSTRMAATCPTVSRAKPSGPSAQAQSPDIQWQLSPQSHTAQRPVPVSVRRSSPPSRRSREPLRSRRVLLVLHVEQAGHLGERGAEHAVPERPEAVPPEREVCERGQRGQRAPEHCDTRVAEPVVAQLQLGEARDVAQRGREGAGCKWAEGERQRAADGVME